MFGQYYWQDMCRSLWSWMKEFLDIVAQSCIHLTMQGGNGLSVAATTDDVERPEEKPRPPTGGKSVSTHKTGIVPTTSADVLVCPSGQWNS